MRISKSKYVAGIQCLKRLYWQVHEPGLATQPDAADEAILEQGRQIGLLARKLFPGGIEVGGSGGLEEQALWILQHFLLTHPDLHQRLL